MSKRSRIHGNCETCKMYEREIEKRIKEIKNIESNYLLHAKKKEFFRICACHGYILYSQQGYDKHVKSVLA